MNRYCIGVDLGSTNDWTAIAVVQRYGEVKPVGFRQEPEWQFQEYRLLHLERYLGLPYTDIARRIQGLLERPELEDAQIVVDATGVGRPVVHLLMEKGLPWLAPVTITGGDSVTKTYVNGLLEYRVPKRDLVGCLQVVLQNQQLRIPSTIELRDELTQELQNFRVKLSESGHDSYEHWRSGDHDDLVLALALACWFPQNGQPGTLEVAMVPL